MIVAFVSYGNDSVALLQYLFARGEDVIALHNDTGWAAPWWAERVEMCEEWVRASGFKCARTESEGMFALAQRKKGWPAGGRLFQFCTTELKVLPARRWLEENDPGQDAILATGVRREESKERRDWPEWSDTERFPGYEMWSPLVRMREAERNEVIGHTPIPVLPHRSKECWPCVNANRPDILTLTEERITQIEDMEAVMGFTKNNKARTLFRPKRHQGAVGIREVFRWAQSDGNYQKGQGFLIGTGSGCDSGMCSG